MKGRVTQQKKAILDMVRNGKGLMTAEEVYDNVRLSQPNLSLGTVYRNLQKFSELGLIARVLLADGKARFEISGHTHHHYLICMTCGKTKDVPWCPIGSEINDYMEKQKFAPVSHQFEVYGYCSACLAAKEE